MIECPNCGGNLKFDIASQQLKCEYCLTMHDPYEVSREKDAEEQNVFDVTVFTCPQCGGEILSTDTSAAEFCSFCGASTILTSRISNEKRPARIIPFKQTKEACKDAYLARVRKAPFAPNELKDKKYIDSFRGIYMPYWVYHISQKGTVRLKGKKSYRRGNYVYTNHYDIEGNIDASYDNLSYDASSSFSDNISEQLAPFDIREQKKFTPSFLSGFYADTADVSDTVYQDNALKIANDTSYNKIRKDAAFSGVTVSPEDPCAMSSALDTVCHAPMRVLYPVWFMSYQKNGRVAYAAVNGQSGKAAADLPVDIGKYVTGTLLLALPIFLALNLIFTLTPGTVLGCSLLLAAASLMIYLTEISKIYQKDHRFDDRGYLYQQSVSAQPMKKEPSKPKPALKDLLKYSQNGSKHKIPGFTGSLAAILICGIIQLWSPIQDYWYYGGALISFLGILFTITGIIRKYNVLATRMLPQFERKGGDDDA